MRNSRGGMSLGGLLALAVTLIVLVLGRQLLSGSSDTSAPTPFPTANFLATLAVQQGTENAMKAAQAGITLEPGSGPLDAIAQFSLATMTAQADWLLNYCESTFAGTRTPNECRTWADQVRETHTNDVNDCVVHTETTIDLGICLSEHKVPLPGDKP